MGYCIEQRMLCFRTICIDDEDISTDIKSKHKQRNNKLSPKQKMYTHHYHNKYKKQKKRRDEKYKREKRRRNRGNSDIELNISNGDQNEEDDFIKKKEIKRYTNRPDTDENLKHSHDENDASFGMLLQYICFLKMHMTVFDLSSNKTDFNAKYGEF